MAKKRRKCGGAVSKPATDWSWWDRLSDERKDGDYSHFSAWGSVMDERMADDPNGDWWDVMDILDRISLYGHMCSLREWAEGGES